MASLAGARDPLRARKKSTLPAGPITVVFEPGVYPLSQPVVFTPEDSGTAERPIVYQGATEPRYPGGPEVVISGGRQITGWKKQNDLFQAAVPEAKGDGWYFTQLYVGGRVTSKT